MLTSTGVFLCMQRRGGRLSGLGTGGMVSRGRYGIMIALYAIQTDVIGLSPLRGLADIYRGGERWTVLKKPDQSPDQEAGSVF